jgi:3-deoxy-D-manno-octulosonate 8-phosphate phosphatase (KDO 8-P phosphatase)
VIKLLLIDVDGTLTDGGITYDGNGIESKTFNVKDGLAMVSWQRLGGKIAIITGRKSTLVEKRMNEINVTHLYQGIKDKPSQIETILKQENLTHHECAAIGDDMNDLVMLKNAKYSFAPYDANPFIYKSVTHPLQQKGANAAVATMIEQLITLNNQTQAYLALWANSEDLSWVGQ